MYSTLCLILRHRYDILFMPANRIYYDCTTLEGLWSGVGLYYTKRASTALLYVMVMKLNNG